LNDKTKQVQVRLAPELHKNLKATLVMDDKKLVDFFDEAARAYLKNPAQYEKAISKILGGRKNG
jgi:hypothetical protein